MTTYLDSPDPVRHHLTEDDLALAHALQLNGRASFTEIAAALGVSDQTAARRYTRLRTTGKLRVLGLTDPFRLGDLSWFVRVRSTPDASASIASALARRTDTTWVSLTSGGTETMASVRSRGPGLEEPFLVRKLPRIPRVVDVSAHCVLHVFFGRDLGFINKSGPLTDAQVAALSPRTAGRSRTTAPGPVVLDAPDRLLLDLLARDGRAPVGELAAATGLSESTVRRRINDLRGEGVLYFDVDYHPDVLHRKVRIALWLEFDPARLAEAGESLAAHPAVTFAAAVTGATNLYANIQVDSPQLLYSYLTHTVSGLPGLRHTVTAPIHRTLKGPGPYSPSRDGTGGG